MARRPSRNTAQNTSTFNVEEERSRQRSVTDMSFPVEFPSSERVQAYRYVPGQDQYYGNLYMRFVKYGTSWVYYNVPIGIYQSFTNSPSKGQFINMTLNSYPNGRAAPSDEDIFFQGF